MKPDPLPPGWTAKHWAAEMERRAVVADASPPTKTVAVTLRCWAAEVREADNKRNGGLGDEEEREKDRCHHQGV